MNISKTYDFIEGTYEPADAKELLSQLIRNKINFHKVNNFSSIIRHDKPDIGSKEKINELNKTKEDILKFIQRAELEQKKLRIFAEIHIEFENKG